jgi:hypothetical protein
MTTPDPAQIERCLQCNGTFHMGDNAQRVRPGSATVRAEFVHLRCQSAYNDTPIPYQMTAKGREYLASSESDLDTDTLATPPTACPCPRCPSHITGPEDVPGTGIQFGDRFVHLVPAAYELQCSCGHQRLNVQLDDFARGSGGVYLWSCPSCDCIIEFDGNDIHIEG